MISRLSLTVNQSAAITSPNNITFTAGALGTFTVVATGVPTPTLSESGNLPNGVTFTAATGVLGGTPSPGSAGTYTLTFTAHNGAGSDASQTFTLTVLPSPATQFTISAPSTVTAGAAAFRSQ